MTNEINQKSKSDTGITTVCYLSVIRKRDVPKFDPTNKIRKLTLHFASEYDPLPWYLSQDPAEMRDGKECRMKRNAG